MNTPDQRRHRSSSTAGHRAMDKPRPFDYARRVRVRVVHHRFALLLASASCARDESATEPAGDTSTSTALADSSSSSSSTSTTTSTTADPAESSSTSGEPFVPIDCTEACLDTTSDAGIALCYSCRCKAAFDNWLPTRDEVQCSAAATVVAYHADLSGPTAVLEPARPEATECTNPSRLTESCGQGSKIGTLQHGDVVLQWICRDPYLDLDGSMVYADMGLIGQNSRTGTACFWDDIDNVTHDDDMPPLDLLEASDEERARHHEVFYFTDGAGCVGCHDHDPFIYTPYLQSAPWTTVAAKKAPYGLLNLDGTVRATGNTHLVSPQASACLACHRLGSESTCGTFARDSMGLDKGGAFEAAVLDAAMPGSPHWALAYWMPGASAAVPDFATWEMIFGAARDHVLTCCEAPGLDVGTCRWEPIAAQ